MSTALSIDGGSFLGLSAALGLSEWQRTAVSDEAKMVARDKMKIDRAIEHSQTLFGRKGEVISELLSVADECSAENWDGEGAYAVEPWAVRTAERFIRVLPEALPMPEAVPEPDGSIGLDWTVSRHQNLSVSFGSGLRLAYAWLDGADRGHAVARFDGETIPRRILDGIRAIYRMPK